MPRLLHEMQELEEARNADPYICGCCGSLMHASAYWEEDEDDPIAEPVIVVVSVCGECGTAYRDTYELFY